MIVQRLTVKFFVQEPTAVSLPAFIPVFHHWIQKQAVPGLLVDVADYKHVSDGPGVILVGHEVDYAMDVENGRLGLLVRRKRQDNTHPLQDQLQTAVQWAIQACQTLTADPALAGQLTFHPDEVEITFPDRLRAPNTPEAWQTYEPTVTAVLQTLYPHSTITLERLYTDPKRLLGYRARLENR